jgi:hypothetical protein
VIARKRQGGDDDLQELLSLISNQHATRRCQLSGGAGHLQGR